MTNHLHIYSKNTISIYEEKQSYLFEASFGIELKNPIEFKSKI